MIAKARYDALLRRCTEAQVMELAFPPACHHIGPGGRRVEREPASARRGRRPGRGDTVTAFPLDGGQAP